MMKRMLAFALLLLLLPAAALAEEAGEEALTYVRQEKKFIDFPTLDAWRGHFSSVTKWVIVTPETLEENWALVSGRGDPEEEIRARYADEHFLFEAYSPDLPADACFRAEVYEDDFTREVWHLRHLDTAERKQLNNKLMSGAVLTDREVYGIVNADTGVNTYAKGYFTNYPPRTHESGQLQIHFRNGRMYVFSYCVTGRLAGASRWYTAKEKAAFDKTPIGSMESRFKSEALPRMPRYELDSAMPEIIAPGTVTIKGTVEAGSTFEAALDGQKLAAQTDKKGNFSVKVPLSEVGEHQLVFTVANAKFTTRTMTYAIIVTDTVTPLTITEEPELISKIGEVTLAGRSAPGAVLTVTLNDGEPGVLTADGEGCFTHSFQVDKRGVNTVHLTALEAGKAVSERDFVFTADYEDFNDAIKVFSQDLTDASFKDICDNVEEHIGEKVKISIRTKEITLNEQGLGLVCVYNAPSGKEKDQTPLYVNLPGYAQCQIGERMIITVYATVDGKRVIFDEDGNEEERIELTAEYGTYLVRK